MALLTEAQVRLRALRISPSMESAGTILREARSTAKTSFDIFLSHARLDSELILGVKLLLEDMGKAVYVD